MPAKGRMSAQKRAAVAKQKRLRRATMTEEELTQLRQKEAERARIRRSQMSEGLGSKHAANRREKSSLSLKSKNEVGKDRIKVEIPDRGHNEHSSDGEKQTVTSEEEKLLRVRALDAERARRRRAQMTEEERRERNAINAARKREKRLALQSEGKIAELRARENEQRRQKRRSQMTDEQLKKASSKVLGKKLKKYSDMTEEERKKRRARKVEYNRQKLARMTEEEKIKFRAKNRNRIRRLKESGSTDERIRGLLSQASELVHRNPARYEAAGAFIKNSLGEIMSMHKEIEGLKRNVRQTVADSFKNAISIHLIEKQARKDGCRSFTFVELSSSSEQLNSKQTIKKEITMGENITDPLLCQSEASIEKSSTNKSQNVNCDQEYFEVYSYDKTAASAANPEEINLQLAKMSFECFICSKKFASSLGLTIHQKDHVDVSDKFKCSICLQMFDVYSSMTKHYLQCHSLEPSTIDTAFEHEESDEEMERHKFEFDFLLERKCLVCFETFDKTRLGLSTYSQHVISQHKENKNLLKNFTYICSGCQKPHTVLRSLECHWKSNCFGKWNNADENNRGIVCADCGINFTNNKSLNSHVKIFHAETDTNESVMCEICSKRLKNEACLKMHLKYVHESENQYTCEYCGKTCKLKQNLAKHMNRVHLGVKPYACSSCHLKFSTKVKLEHHMQEVHLLELPFACIFCPMRFLTNIKLGYHMNNHTGEKPYKCKMCDKHFSSKTALYSHERRHLRKSVDNGGATFESSLRKISVQSSPGEGTYVCDICGKGYKTSYILRDHKYTHDKLERFGCSLCPRRFRQTALFYQHKQKKHPSQGALIVKFSKEEIIANNSKSPEIPYSDKVPVTNYNSDLPQQPLAMNYNKNYYTTAENVSVPIYSNHTDRDINDDYRPNQLYNYSMPIPPSSNLMDFSAAKVPPLEQSYESNVVVDQEDSIELDDCSHSIESDDEVRNDGNVYTNNSKPGVSKSNTEQESDLTSSKFVDFSRANVPLQAVCDAVNDVESTSTCKLEQDDAFIENELKMPAESESESNIIVKTQDFKSIMIVKLRRLLEYKCTPCEKTVFASNQREIVKHKRSRIHRNNARLKNTKSKSKSDNLERKSDNLKRNSRGPRGFDCIYCDKKKINSTDALIAHCATEHPGKEPLKCPFCPRLFFKTKRYFNHKTKVHTFPKPYQRVDPNVKKEFLCENCGKAFHSQQAVWVHRSTMHRREKAFKCDMCPKTFQMKSNLKLHRGRIHLKIKPHLCEECGKTFFTPLERKRHVMKEHRDTVMHFPYGAHKYFCTLCPYVFLTEKGLIQHKPLHDPEREFGCDECGLRFKLYDTLWAHKRNKHKRNGKRNLCRILPPPPPHSTVEFINEDLLS